MEGVGLVLKDRIDYFEYAYTSDSFSKAAAKVPMSAQGFTKAIVGLEHELGVQLFVKDATGRRTPTAYADALHIYAERVLSERTKLQRAFDDIAKTETVELNVGISLGIRGLLGDIATGFRKVQPKVVLKVEELADLQVDQLLQSGGCDLALTLAPYPAHAITRQLFPCGVSMWVPTDDVELASKDSLTVEDLVGKRIIMPGLEFKCCQSLMKAFTDKGLPEPEVVERVEIFWIYDAVLQGRGTGFTLPHLDNLEAFLQSDQVVAVPLEGVSWSFGISYPEGQALSIYETSYIDYVTKRAQRVAERIALTSGRTLR